jgi:sec-independent protein translocase protein TatA
MSLGIFEILLVLALGILFFGAKRIPLIARGIGEGIRNFRSSVKDEDPDRRVSGGQPEEDRRISGDRDP